jgi:peptidyl-tRNA hydrolase
MTDADPQFLAFLQAEESRAYDGTLLSEVEAAINSYNGANYGDEEDGRSQVVARDVAETTDYMLTSVLDVFVSSGRVVEFEPQNEGDEDLCDDATEAMHYIYRRKSGYRLIHDWAKAGLLEKIGVVKCCVERKRQRVEGLYHPAEFPENAIQAQETDQLHSVDGSPMIHAVTLEETAAAFPDYHVPLEEFRIAPDATDLDSAVYLAHVTQKSLSELTEMGFDITGIDLSQGENAAMAVVTTARDDGRSTWLGVDDRLGANRKVWLSEEYVLYDLNGDGIAERLCVHRVGTEILGLQETDYQPFEYWCPYPMQGRLIGQSLADKTMDIQRVNTVVERLMLDSGYQQISPGTFIDESFIGDHTLDDLLTVRPGRIVRTIGGYPVPEQRVDITGSALQILAFKQQQRESRTGITRLNKGVDEDTLNETARGQAMLMARGQQMERYIIRNFAEGVARLFMKKVGLMRRYGQPMQIRVDGEYRQVDPSQWPESMEVQVVVGLGSGSKQDRIMYRQAVAQAQAMAMQSQAPLCTWENVFNNLSALARDMNLPPNDLWTHPQDNPQQPQPDPKMMELQQQLMLKQQELAQQQQHNQDQLRLMASKQMSDASIQAAKDHMEAALELQRQAIEKWLAEQQMKLDAAKHAATLDNQSKIAKMRPGGKLDK